MPEGDPIDEFYVRLSADTSQFLEGINEAIKRAMAMTESAVVEISKTWEEIFADVDVSRMGEVIAEVEAKLRGIAKVKGFEFRPGEIETILELMTRMIEEGSEIGEMIKIIELSTQSWEEQGHILGVIQKLVAGVGEHYEQIGMAIPVEKMKSLHLAMTNIIEAAAVLGVTEEEAIQRLVEVVEKEHRAAEALDQKTTATQKATEATEKLEKRLVELGKTMPVEKLEQFRARVQKLWQDGLKAGRSIKELTQATDQMAQATVKSTGFIGQLTEMLGKNVAGITAVALAYKGIMFVVGKIQQMIKKSIDLVIQDIEANFRLSMAVRQHQRAVGELSPTIAEALEFSKKMADSYRINEQEAKALYGQTLLLTREYKLNKEQAEGLQESVIVLSEALGKNYQTALSAVTQAMMTGGSEAMRQLGIDIDEDRIALEGLRRGYIDFGETLSDTQRALIVTDIVIEEGNKLKEDAAKFQENWAGKVEESQKKIDNLTERIGEGLIVILAELMGALGDLATFLEDTFDTATTAAAQSILIIENWFHRQILIAEKTRQKMQEERRRWLTPEEMDLIRREATLEANAATAEKVAEQNEEAYGIMSDASDAHGKVIEDWADTMDTAWHKVMQIIAKESPKLAQQEEKLITDLERRLDQITERFGERRRQLMMQYNRAIEDIDRQATERRTEVTRQYHLNEERALEDHRIRMQQIEEDYLWDLTDAVRERDAKAVLMAKRRYERERKQERQDYRLEKSRRNEDFKLELQDIEYQRRMRRAQRLEEFNERMAELEYQEELERQKAQENHSQKMRDLHKQFFEELNLKIDHITEDLNLDSEHYEELAKRLLAYWGPHGYHQQVLDGALSITTSYADAMRTILQSIYGGTTTLGSGISVGEEPIPYQRGGTFYATSPTMLKVGETPERVDITRLSAATGAVRDARATGGPGGQRLQVDLNVLADDRLIVEVADQTMNEVADVFVDIQRDTQRRLRQ